MTIAKVPVNKNIKLETSGGLFGSVLVLQNGKKALTSIEILASDTSGIFQDRIIFLQRRQAGFGSIGESLKGETNRGFSASAFVL